MSTRTVSKTISLDSFPRDAASKYITKINNTGIKIHPEVYNGSSAAEKSSYIQLDGTGMELFNSNGDSIAKYGEDIRLGNENEGKLLITAGGQGRTYEDAGTYIIDGSDNILAQFLENGAQIGLNGKSHLEMDNNGMRLIDRDNTKYFEVSDLRDDDDFLVDRFVGDGQKFAFVLSSMAIEPSSADNTAVTIDGIPQTLGEGSSEHWYIVSTYSYYSMVEFPYDSPPADGAVIVVKYMSSENTTALTFGTRKQEAPVGGLSSVFGENCEARMACTFAQGKGTVAIFKNQAVFGRYNDPDEEGDYGLVIGNGTANNARSNALTVDWDGRLRLNNVHPIYNTNTYIQIRHSSIDSDGTPPTSGTIYSGAIYSFDTDGARIGHFENYYDTSGNIGATIGSSRVINGSPKYNNITSIIKADGTYTYSVSSAVAFRKAINIYSTYTFYTASATNQTISATSNKTVTITIPAATMSGKTILAIRGWNFNNSSSGGQNCSVCVPYSCMATGNTVTLEIRNNASSQAKIDIYVYCILVENNS